MNLCAPLMLLCFMYIAQRNKYLVCLNATNYPYFHEVMYLCRVHTCIVPDLIFPAFLLPILFRLE